MNEEKTQAKYHYQSKQVIVDDVVWKVYRWIDKKGNELPSKKQIGNGHPIDIQRKISFQ